MKIIIDGYEIEGTPEESLQGGIINE